MSDITDRAAKLNREAWNSFIRQRVEGLTSFESDRLKWAREFVDGRRQLPIEYFGLVAYDGRFPTSRLSDLAGGIEGKRVLDMGCGDGYELWLSLVECIGSFLNPILCIGKEP